jgi:hypothetical protein
MSFSTIIAPFVYLCRSHVTSTFYNCYDSHLLVGTGHEFQMATGFLLFKTETKQKMCILYIEIYIYLFIKLETDIRVQ